MKLAAELRFKTYVLLAMLICFGPVGDLLMSKGMRRIGTAPSWAPSALLHHGFLIFTSPIMWLGTLSLIGFFISYTTVLSWADYSYIQPVSALNYGIVAVLGKFILAETVTPMRWAGIVVVCAGVLIIGYTPPRTTEPILEAEPGTTQTERETETADVV